jgi:hypothetical protein
MSGLTGGNHRSRAGQSVVSIALEVATCNPEVVPATLCKVTDAALQMFHIKDLLLASQWTEVLMTTPLHCQREHYVRTPLQVAPQPIVREWRS